MRLRLHRLLCWRESPERWPSYQHMLPVLILARSLRQCEHWQHTVETTALKLRLDPLAGALACLPPSENAHVNPWVLNWRTLSTDVSCHLQDLLRPLPRAAFPPSLRLEESEDEVRDMRSSSKASLAAASSGRPTRFSRLIFGKLAHRTSHIAQDELEEREIIAMLGLRLTSCQWSILRLLLAHPFLTDEELAALLNLLRRSVRCSLYELHQLGCIGPIKTAAGKRWHLCARGLRLVAAASHLHIHTIAVTSDDEAEREPATILQRGEAWLLQHIQHTAGVYEFFAQLVQNTRQEAGQALCWWENGAMCERRYQLHEHWHNLRPDALAEYAVGQQRMRFWLEWDRGTMNARDLGIKFRSYAHFIASREWARERAKLPLLVCIAPDTCPGYFAHVCSDE
jgi:hypothetical protein